MTALIITIVVILGISGIQYFRGEHFDRKRSKTNILLEKQLTMQYENKIWEESNKVMEDVEPYNYVVELLKKYDLPTYDVNDEDRSKSFKVVNYVSSLYHSLFITYWNWKGIDFENMTLCKAFFGNLKENSEQIKIVEDKINKYFYDNESKLQTIKTYKKLMETVIFNSRKCMSDIPSPLTEKSPYGRSYDFPPLPLPTDENGLSDELKYKKLPMSWRIQMNPYTLRLYNDALIRNGLVRRHLWNKGYRLSDGKGLESAWQELDTTVKIQTEKETKYPWRYN